MSSRKKPLSNEENLRKALSTLVSSLMDDNEGPLSRVELVEEALAYAAMALGAEAADPDKIEEKLERLAAQVMIDGLGQDGTATRHLSILNEEKEEAVAIVTTAHPLLLQQMNDLVERHVRAISYQVN